MKLTKRMLLAKIEAIDAAAARGIMELFNRVERLEDAHNQVRLCDGCSAVIKRPSK